MSTNTHPIITAIEGVVSLLEAAVNKGAHSAEEVQALHQSVSAALTPVAMAAMKAQAFAAAPTPAPAPAFVQPAPAPVAAVAAPATPAAAPGGTAAILATAVHRVIVLVEQFYQMNGNVVMLNTVKPQFAEILKSLAHLLPPPAPPPPVAA